MSGAQIIVKADEVFKRTAVIRQIPESLREPTVTLLKVLKGRMQTYPAPPSGSSYVRAYLLRNSWHYRALLSGEVLGTVYSEGADHVMWVQEAATQAGIHRGRWDTEEKVAAEEEETAVQIFDDYLAGQLA